MIEEATSFHGLLRRYRQAAALSQEALAERAGLSVDAISQLESGRRTRPRLETVRLLAEALALTGAQRAAFEAAAHRPVVPTLTVGVQSAKQVARSRPAVRELPLVGRTAELALLDRHLTQVGPPLLLLAGEPGIGKSCLLREAAHHAAAAGWQTLEGGCTRRGGQEPYAPLPEALERHMQGLSAARQRQALAGCAWLVRLLPELAAGPIEPLPAWQVTPEQERRLIFKAVARFLTNVAGPAGTLLVLDDLQWAGADTLDLLAMLARMPQTPVRMLGAYRDLEVQAQDPLAVALADLAQAGVAQQQPLRPLAAAEVHHLLDRVLAGWEGDHAALAARILERSGGVPFFVVSCVQALRDEGDAGVQAIPWEVRQSIRQRVAALPVLAQEVLGAAAIAVRRTAQAAVLAAVLEEPEREVLRALEAAWQARLLEQVEGGYRLAHDLIREVLEAGLGPARRVLLHRRIAEVLEGRPGVPSEVLAYHYGRGDIPERAVGYLEQAGDLARAQHGLVAAEGFYREAVEQLDRLGRPLDAARVREKLGGILLTMAQFTQALAVLEQAVPVLHLAGDAEGMCRVVAWIGRVHVHKGTLEEGIARLRAQLERLAMDGPSSGLAELYETLAHLHYLRGQLDAGLAESSRSAAMARAMGDSRLLARAQARRGHTLLMMGRAEQALPLLREACALAEAAGHLTVLGNASQALAVIAEDRGEFDRAWQYAAQMLAAGERLGDAVQIRQALFRLAAQAFFTGAWGEAHAHMQRVQELPDRSSNHDAFAVLELGRLAMVEGALDQATRYLEQCCALLRNGGHVYLTAAGTLAECEVLAGRPRAAARAIAAPDEPRRRTGAHYDPLRAADTGLGLPGT